MAEKVSFQGRRNALFSAAAGISLTAAGVAPSRAAQVQQVPATDIALLEEVGAVMSKAEAAFVDFALTSELGFDIEKLVRDQLPKLIRDLAKYDVLLLVLHDQIILTRMMLASGVSPTPDVKDLARPPEKIIIKPQEQCSDVFVAILWDTFGFDVQMRADFRTFLKGRNLESLAKQIGQAARAEDWPRVALLLRKFLFELLGSEALAHLEKVIGKEALKKVLGVLASRFVPLIGWALLGIDLIRALQRNWPSLEKCKL